MDKQRTKVACSQELDTLAAPRWKAVRRGLSLTTSYFGVIAFIWIYAIWLLIAAILGLVVMPFAIRGKVDFLNDILNPFALYGFVWPVALTLAAMWTVKLFSRFLWCRIPQPSMARFLALASVAGRLSTLFALGWVWRSSEPFGKRLLLPETVVLSGIAWLCLIAEWGFMRVLEYHFIGPAQPGVAPSETDKAVANATGAAESAEPRRKGLLKRDVGEEFKRRFPKVRSFFSRISWILLLLASVISASMADSGNIHAVPAAILRLAVIAPVILQTFWIPGDQINRLVDAFSPSKGQENVRST
jgi:hypothetical protein